MAPDGQFLSPRAHSCVALQACRPSAPWRPAMPRAAKARCMHCIAQRCHDPHTHPAVPRVRGLPSARR
eukprot:7284809-Pyramimonas_sp.AAC.1